MRPTEILRRERGWEVKSWRQETSQETAVTSWQGLTRLGHGQGRWEWAEDRSNVEGSRKLDKTDAGWEMRQ